MDDNSPNPLDIPFIPSITLDRESSVPLYQQIATPLEELIQSGRIEPGRLIEDEVSMARRLEVSRPTARRALHDLVVRGLLSRRRGAGTRVTPTHVRRSLGLTSLHDDLLKAGFAPTTEVVAYEILLASEEESTLLGVPEGEEVVRIVRRRLIDGRPLSVLTNLIPAATAPSVTQLTKGGLYATLADKGIHPVSAQQSIGARAATPAEAEQLGVPVGSPLLTMERTAHDAEGRVVEAGTHIYNPELYSFHFTLSGE